MPHTLACAGLAQGVPTGHTVLLCMVLAPLGLLSHVATKVSSMNA